MLLSSQRPGKSLNICRLFLHLLERSNIYLAVLLDFSTFLACMLTVSHYLDQQMRQIGV